MQYAQPLVIDLNDSNFQQTLDGHDFVLVNFYAEWCRFSRDLAPIFEAAGDAVTKEFENTSVVLGRVDCDKQGNLFF